MPYGRGPAPATQLPLFVLNAMPYGRGPAGLTTLQAVANRNRHPAGKVRKERPAPPGARQGRARRVVPVVRSHGYPPQP